MGSLFVVSAPSGAGKTSLLRAMVEQKAANITLSVSHTTRAPRDGEVNGEHYHFVTHDKFSQMISEGDFLEYANVHGAFYGTSKKVVDSMIYDGKNLVLEIDWQGARAIRELYQQLTSIFILPPSIEELELRLRQRNQNDEKTIQRRMLAAKEEMAHQSEYDHIITNSCFSEAFSQLAKILNRDICRAI